MISKAWFVLAILLGFACGLWAQGDRGIIRGTVQDETGAVVPGAPVIATNVATMTRFNPKGRNFAILDESVSLAKSFQVSEPTRLEFRAEAFNLLNRVRFGPLPNATTLQNPNFGFWRMQANTPRQMQLSLKLYW